MREQWGGKEERYERAGRQGNRTSHKTLLNVERYKMYDTTSQVLAPAYTGVLLHLASIAQVSFARPTTMTFCTNQFKLVTKDQEK